MEGTNRESVFLIPFNIFYFFGLTPFKTYYDQDNDRYHLRTNPVQKVICAVVHIVATVYQVYYVINCCRQFKLSSETSIVALFEVVSNFSFLVSILLLIYHMWMEQEIYLELLEYTRCNRKPGKCGGPFCVYTTLIVCCLFLAVVSWFLLNDSEHLISQTLLFYNSTSIQLESERELGNESNFQFYSERVIYWANTMLYIHSINFYVFVQGLFFVLILALQQLGAEFRTEIKKSKENDDTQKGIQLYRKLKRTTDLTHKMYGDCLLSFYIGSVSYYAEAPHILMGKRGDTEIVILVAFVITSLLWIWAAEFHKRVYACMVEWIAFNMEKGSLCLEDLKLLSIRSEISSDPVALSCRCFCVTYKHICSMFGVVATYGVIVVQLNRD